MTLNGQHDYMITGKNESKTSTKHLSCECKCKFDCRKHNSYQKWDSDKYWCEFEKQKTCEKNYTCNPAICSCENGKFLANIMLDSFTFIMKLYYFTLKRICNIMITYSQVHPTGKCS